MAGAADLRRALRLRPPLLALTLTLAALAANRLLFGAASLGAAPLAGALLAAAGTAWTLWAALLFRRAATTLRPVGKPIVLVEEGPYRLGRNPMYLGLAAVMAGTGIAFGAPLVAAAIVAFVAVVDRVHIPFEEQRLRSTFGGWYSDYAAQTRRWL